MGPALPHCGTAAGLMPGSQATSRACSAPAQCHLNVTPYSLCHACASLLRALAVRVLPMVSAHAPRTSPKNCTGWALLMYLHITIVCCSSSTAALGVMLGQSPAAAERRTGAAGSCLFQCPTCCDRDRFHAVLHSTLNLRQRALQLLQWAPLGCSWSPWASSTPPSSV